MFKLKRRELEYMRGQPREIKLHYERPQTQKVKSPIPPPKSPSPPPKQREEPKPVF